MKIYANGCSFTYGDELTNPSKNAWPVLLSNSLHATLNNDATSGGTNYRTVYRTIKNLKNNYDLYLIAWTDYSRFTFYRSTNNEEINLNSRLKNDTLRKSLELTDWAFKFYKHWYNELYAFKLWLQQIIQLQSVLQNKSYIMINTFPNNIDSWTKPKDQFIDSVKYLINFDLMNDEQIFAEYEEIQYYISNIDFTKFYKWQEFYIFQLCKLFPIGPFGHILDQGHEHVAKLLYNHICLK
jgi:hypothetical protein